MVSTEQIRDSISKLPPGPLRRLDPERLAALLNKHGQEHGVELTLYGLIKWAAERYGGNALYENVLMADKTIAGYASTAKHYKEDMPAALVNAGNYMKALTSQIGDMETCIRQLEQMSFPYVIYVLFAGAGHAEMVAKFKGALDEQLKRYPSTLDLVPERYKVKEVDNADSGQC